jgi:hypothetical protein
MVLATLLRRAVWLLHPSGNCVIDASAVLRRAPATACCSNVAPVLPETLHGVWLPAPSRAGPQRVRFAAKTVVQTRTAQLVLEPSVEPCVAVANIRLEHWLGTEPSLQEHALKRQQGAMAAVGFSAAQARSSLHATRSVPWQSFSSVPYATKAQSTADVSQQWHSAQHTWRSPARAAASTQAALPLNLDAVCPHHLVSDGASSWRRCFATRPAPRPSPPPPPTPSGPGSGIDGVKHIVAVASGKGGVGKSTTAGRPLHGQRSHLSYGSTAQCTTIVHAADSCPGVLTSPFLAGFAPA